MSESTHYPTVWWDGHQSPLERATIPLVEMGTAAVSSVFEGIRAYQHPETRALSVFQLDAHLRRFLQSIRLIRLQCDYDIATLHDAVVELVRVNAPEGDSYIRPFAYAQSRTFGSATSPLAHVIIHVTPWESKLKTDTVSHSAVSSWTRLTDNQMAPRVKATANYLNSRYASAEAQRNGYDHAILLTPQGRVAEGPGMCLMLVRNGQLITPSVTSGILESITRDTILELARRDLGLPVVEREVDRTELYTADEAFFCGTGIELVPIVTIDRLNVGTGQPGAVTRLLADYYHNVVRGLNPAHSDWLTPIPPA